MSNEPRPEQDKGNAARSQAQRTQAQVRRGWWPGWIWAIPIAAVLLVGWWLLRTVFSGGENITINFDDAHGVKKSDTKVMYRGMQVGEVTGVALAKDGRSVVVTAQIQDAAGPFLTSGTQFWLRGAEPSLSNPASLSAVLSGPTLMMEPGPGEKTRHFTGLVRRPIVSGAHGPPDVYGVSLSGSVGGLSAGQPVKLRGFTVGEIKDIGFRYDAASGHIETPVTLALYPSLFHIEGANASNGDAALRQTIDDLIRKGLRARLERDPPLVGSPEVALDIVPGASEAAAPARDGVPQIPAASGGGIESIVDRVNKVPVDEIANNVLDITHHVDALVASTQLHDAINQLDATVAEVHQTVATAGPQVTELVDRLRQTSAQIDRAVHTADSALQQAQRTAASADKMLGGTPNQTGMNDATREITEAARSVRELANYLDRHPEALVRGRGNQ